MKYTKSLPSKSLNLSGISRKLIVHSRIDSNFYKVVSLGTAVICLNCHTISITRSLVSVNIGWFHNLSIKGSTRPIHRLFISINVDPRNSDLSYSLFGNNTTSRLLTSPISHPQAANRFSATRIFNLLNVTFNHINSATLESNVRTLYSINI